MPEIACEPKLSRYAVWIRRNGPKSDLEAYGHCQSYTLRMKDEFPELEVQIGWYHDSPWGLRGHWWLVSSDGEIVDPTARQFPSKGTGRYEFVKEADRPIGKCANCGSFCYNGAPSEMLCSEQCEIEFRGQFI